jgi:hypothetical protein
MSASARCFVAIGLLLGLAGPSQAVTISGVQAPATARPGESV